MTKLSVVVLVGTATLSIAALVARSAARPTNPAVAASELPPPEEQRECPHDYRKGYGHTTTPLFPAVAGPSAIAGRNQNVPEYNDCQRFFVKGPGGQYRYDSLYAIFAPDRLDTLVDSLDTQLQGNPADKIALAFGDIASDGKYPPLGLVRGQNCLYMWRSAVGDPANPATSVWEATIMNSTYPNFASLARCSKPIPISVATLGHRLSVRKPSTFPGLKKDDYPAVARWDFDAASGVQYIGVKCGAAWCEVGPKGFTPSPAAFADDPSQSAKWRRVRLVKGWYDRQLLAVPGQDASGHEIAVPSGIDGIIMPDERLDDLNLFDPYRDHMIHTATVILRSTPLASTDLAKYRTIFGIPAGVTLPITLEVSLCYGSPVSCTLPPGAPAPCIAEGTGDDNPAFDVTPPPHDPARRWFSLVQGPGFKVARCIRRFSNFDPATGGPFRTTGTTRWRWKANDEGGWMRCAPGCCEQL